MISKTQHKQLMRAARKRRVRAKVSGTAERPRLSVYRSAAHISAQLIDDEAGKTIAAASDQMMDKKDLAAAKKGEEKRRAKVAVAHAVGAMIAEKAKKAGVKRAVFDRNGFAYAGRIAALAEGARDGGLTF